MSWRALLMLGILASAMMVVQTASASPDHPECSFEDDEFCALLEENGSCENIDNTSALVNPAACGRLVGEYCAANADPTCNKITTICEEGGFPVEFCEAHDEEMGMSLGESQSSGLASNETVIGIASGVGILLLVLLIIGVIIKRRGDADDILYSVDAEFDATDAFNQQQAWHAPEMVQQVMAPTIDMRGQIADDGFEWLEFPQASGSWFYRDRNTGQWVPYQR